MPEEIYPPRFHCSLACVLARLLACRQVLRRSQECYLREARLELQCQRGVDVQEIMRLDMISATCREHICAVSFFSPLMEEHYVRYHTEIARIVHSSHPVQSSSIQSNQIQSHPVPSQVSFSRMIKLLSEPNMCRLSPSPSRESQFPRSDRRAHRHQNIVCIYAYIYFIHLHTEMQ